MNTGKAQVGNAQWKHALNSIVVGMLFMVAALTGCKDQPRSTPPAGSNASTHTNVQVYEVKGEVRELKPDGKTVVIKHEAVTNYMPAMIMPFEVKNTNELQGVSAGDEVAFRMLVTEKEGWIEGIQVLKHKAPAPPVRQETRVVRNVEPLAVGDAIPNYPFTNQLGKAVSLADFKGQAVAFTFIFTRCPFPNFCPRMSSHFREVQDALKRRTDVTNWQLLSISFDTDYDTPETLKAYAEKQGYDPGRWSFLTGALIEIDAITEQFGLVFPREGVNFAHNLRTVILDPAGKVHKIVVGNEWQPTEVIEEMVKAAAKGR